MVLSSLRSFTCLDYYESAETIAGNAAIQPFFAYPIQMSALDIKTRGGASRFAVRLQPRASTNEIAGLQGSALRIRVTAPPVDGAANDALVALIAKTLGVAKRDVTIAGGASSRNKIVEVAGVGPEAILELAG